MSETGSGSSLPTHSVGHSPTVHLPRPTMWPSVMAAGITMIAAGLILSLFFSLAGAIVFAIALGGWIGDLRNG